MALGVNQRTEPLFTTSDVQTVAGGVFETVNTLRDVSKVSELVLQVENDPSSAGPIGFSLETAMSAEGTFYTVDAVNYTAGAASTGTGVLDAGDSHVFHIPGYLSAGVGSSGISHHAKIGGVFSTVMEQLTAGTGICLPLVVAKLTINTDDTNGAYTFSASLIFRG